MWLCAQLKRCPALADSLALWSFLLTSVSPIVSLDIQPPHPASKTITTTTIYASHFSPSSLSSAPPHPLLTHIACLASLGAATIVTMSGNSTSTSTSASPTVPNVACNTLSNFSFTVFETTVLFMLILSSFATYRYKKNQEYRARQRYERLSMQRQELHADAFGNTVMNV